MPKVKRKSNKSLRAEKQKRYKERQMQSTSQCAETLPVAEHHVGACIVRGTFHQGHASLGNAAGKQCTCASLAFMLRADIQPHIHRWTSDILDDIVRQGTRIYNNIPNKTRTFLLITDLPETIFLHNKYTLDMHEPFGGTIGTSQTEGPFYTVHDALTATFRESSQAFLTINTYTSAIVRSPLHNQMFFLFDSHSRGCEGYQCQNGTSVCMGFASLEDLTQYIHRLTESFSENSQEEVFEITPVIVHRGQAVPENLPVLSGLAPNDDTSCTIYTNRAPGSASKHANSNADSHSKLHRMATQADGASCSHWPDPGIGDHSAQNSQDSAGSACTAHCGQSQVRQLASPYDRKKAHEKERYWSDPIFRVKKQRYAKDRHYTNPGYAQTHREQMLTHWHDMYQNNPKVAESERKRFRTYKKNLYQNNPEFAADHREKMREHMSDLYQNDPVFAADHREKMREHMSDLYQNDPVFAADHRNHMHDLYQNNPVFAADHRKHMHDLYQNNPVYAADHREHMRVYRHNQYSANKNAREKIQEANQQWRDKKKEEQSDLKTAIHKFKLKATEAPRYVCCCCNRLFFKRQVDKCHPDKYTINRQVIEQSITTDLRHLCTDACDADCSDAKGPKAHLWVCRTCHGYLKKGAMPNLSVGNGLALEPQPDELAGLNSLEQQLIALRLPFMKLVSLPSGRQKGVQGPVVLVPANVAKTATALPRMIGEAQIVSVKLKRKLSFAGHVAHRDINTGKVNNALAYLKGHSPHYKDIAVNEDWHETSEDGLQQLQGDDTVMLPDSAASQGTEDSPENILVPETCLSGTQPNAAQPDYIDQDTVSDSTQPAKQIQETCESPSRQLSNRTTEQEAECDEPNELQGVANDSCVQPLDIHSLAIAEMQDAIVSVAPAEGNSPVSIFLADHAEAQTFPALFPTGKNTFDEERSKKISRLRYYNARLLSADTRFVQNTDYVFHAQFATELEQLQSGISIQLRKGSQKTVQGDTITAGMLGDREQFRNLLKTDRAFTFMRAMRGSPEYWRSTMADLFSMVRTLGIPTWFLSFSSAEQSRWPEVVETIAELNGQKVDFSKLEYEEVCEWLRLNPAISVRMFDHRVKLLMKDLIKGPANPVGKVTDHFYRVEFQKRGAPHIHLLLWVEGAPEIGKDSDEFIARFIDQYISCKLPGDDEPDLQETVKRVQTHSKNHKKSCKSATKACRFNFPRPVAKETFILRPPEAEEPGLTEEPTSQQLPTHAEKKQLAKEHLANLYDLLERGTHVEKTIDETVLAAGFLDYADFQAALSLLSRKPSVIMARETKDVWVNNYNPALLEAWNANIDIQFVLDPYSCIMYILSYISKSEHELGEILRNAQIELREEQGNTDLKKQMRKLGSVYFQHREVSVQEAVVRTIGLPLKSCSRDTVFLATDDNATRMSKPLCQIQREAENNEDSSDIWLPSRYEKYKARPQNIADFDTMCQASFAADYRVLSKSVAEEAVKKKNPNVYKLQNQLGYVMKRTDSEPAIVRFPRFSQTRDPERYYQTLLKLYLPHRDESQLRPHNFDTYEVFYNTGSVAVPSTTQVCPVKDIVNENRAHFEQKAQALDQALEQAQDLGHLEDAWANIAPAAEQARLEDESQIVQHAGEPLATDDVPELANPPAPTIPSLCSVELLNNANIQPLTRSLNQKQGQLLYFVRKWCWQTVYGERPEPFYLHLNGGAGVGKSHVVKCIYNEATRILQTRYSPTDTTVLLVAPTGTAAFNVGGHTIHSVFKIPPRGPYLPLSDDTLNTMQAQLANLKILIIDEISMVDRRVLSYINSRLRQIKRIRSTDTTSHFGNVSVLAVGDFYQLPPVRAHTLLKPNADEGIDLWHDNFKVLTLDQVMRQRDDACFAAMLNRMRVKAKTDSLLAEDEEALQARCDLTEPADALHVFCTNRLVEKYNTTMLQMTCENPYKIYAVDFTKDLTTGSRTKIQRQKGGSNDLPNELHTAIGARVMLLRNIAVADGLVNGAFGTVVGFEPQTCVLEEPATPHEPAQPNISAIYVKFDSERIGLRQKPHCRNDLPTSAVCIQKHDEDMANYKRISRRQFPLKLAWACTVHKTQGMTTDKCVFDMTGVFQEGQAYVALSRVTTLSGLYIRNFNPKSIYRNNLISEYLAKMTPLEPEPEPTEPYMDLIHHNIRGLLSRLADVAATLRWCPCSALLLNETFLGPDKHFHFPALPQILRQDRAGEPSHGGGIAVLLQENITAHKQLTAVPQQSCEHLAYVMQPDTSILILVVSIYRRPSQSIALFKAALSRILSFAATYDNVIFAGDFNEDLRKTSPTTIRGLFESHGYNQHVNEVTTISGTWIDHVYSKTTLDISAKVMPTHYSDHHPVRIRIIYPQNEQM